MLDSILSMNVSSEYKQFWVKSDQFRLTQWLSQHTNMATLDYSSSIFRNLNFGVVTPSVLRTDPLKWNRRGKTRSCGPDTVRECYYNFNPPYTGEVNHTSLHIRMHPVPGCQANERPFSLHGAGHHQKGLLAQIASDLRRLEERAPR